MPLSDNINFVRYSAQYKLFIVLYCNFEERSPWQSLHTLHMRLLYGGTEVLKLPSLFVAWLFIINHIIWKHWSFLVIRDHHFSHLLVYMEKINFCDSLCILLEYFHEKKCPPDYPCKSHDHAHQWAYLVMVWLPQAKRKCEHKVVRLVFVNILLSTCQWVHTAVYSVHANESTQQFTQYMPMSPHSSLLSTCQWVHTAVYSVHANESTQQFT